MPNGYHLVVFAETHRDYDILTWDGADGWAFRVVEVRGGRDVGAVAEGTAPTEAAALAAADAEVSRLRRVENEPG